LGLLGSVGEKNCSSVGGWKAGACTSEEVPVSLVRSQVEGFDRAPKESGTTARNEVHTLAYSLHSADLGAILHGVKCEVDLGDGALVGDSAHSGVDILVLLHGLVRHDCSVYGWCKKVKVRVGGGRKGSNAGRVAEGQESNDPVAAKTPRPCDFVAVFLDADSS
jgi:hypothetical protein